MSVPDVHIEPVAATDRMFRLGKPITHRVIELRNGVRHHIGIATDREEAEITAANYIAMNHPKVRTAQARADNIQTTEFQRALDALKASR